MNVISCSQRKKTVYDQQYAQNVRYDNVTTESLIKPAEKSDVHHDSAVYEL